MSSFERSRPIHVFLSESYLSCVPDDEEGFIMCTGGPPPAVTGHTFYPVGGPYNSSTEDVNLNSPALSSMGVPSRPLVGSRASLSGPPQFVPCHLSSSSRSVYDDFVMSISAPSHKQVFNHSLYPPDMLLESTAA
ncbi:hypothetical protein C8R44DRAFT_873723 [Mycena epipterygia]|nr:hypothetical protein C8R44DRAFT_873723 [Mycena epipterygia]